MAVYVSNIVIEQGFDFDTSFQLEDTRTNAFLDLTNLSAKSFVNLILTLKSGNCFIAGTCLINGVRPFRYR